jgi:hypothetical protein
VKAFSRVLAILLFASSQFSCTSGGLKVKATQPLPERGIVHKKICCREDSARTYSLYIPKGSVDKGMSGQGDKETEAVSKFPLAIAFDPQGNGSLPVEKYKELAEKYGFIIAGSNNSKNGLPPEEIDQIVFGLMKEFTGFYPVDTARILLMGFSGGARIASLTAFYKIHVNGVIGCGAGFAGASAPPVFKVDYFGIAGMGDFNMNEMVELDYPLTQAGLRHVITTFEGIHAWPPVNIMALAFQWFSLNAMKDGLVTKNTTFIQEIISGFEKKMDRLIECGQLLEAVNAGKEAIAFGEGLTSTGKFMEQITSVEKMPRYELQAKYRKKVTEAEEAERKLLIEALTDKDLRWWRDFEGRLTRDEGRGTKDEGRGTKDEGRGTKDEGRRINNAESEIKVLSQDDWQKREETFKNQRVLAFVRLLAYMNANSVLTSKNEEAAVKIVTIYEIVDPGNPEPYYMQAILSARKSNTKEALQQLEQAIDKGFKDRLRMAEQPEFLTLKETPGFYDLLQKIKQ